MKWNWIGVLLILNSNYLALLMLSLWNREHRELSSNHMYVVFYPSSTFTVQTTIKENSPDHIIMVVCYILLCIHTYILEWDELTLHERQLPSSVIYSWYCFSYCDIYVFCAYSTMAFHIVVILKPWQWPKPWIFSSKQTGQKRTKVLHLNTMKPDKSVYLFYRYKALLRWKFQF